MPPQFTPAAVHSLYTIIFFCLYIYFCCHTELATTRNIANVRGDVTLDKRRHKVTANRDACTGLTCACLRRMKRMIDHPIEMLPDATYYMCLFSVHFFVGWARLCEVGFSWFLMYLFLPLDSHSNFPTVNQ